MHLTAPPLQLPEVDFLTLLERQGPSLALWRAAEVAALREQPYEGPVLDLGCGDGLVTSLVLSRVDVGLDPCTGALDRARRIGIYRSLIPEPIESARLPAGSIATILSNSVLEHVEALDEVLDASARLLRAGGRLIFTVPTEAFSPALALPLNSYRDWRNRSYRHINLWPLARWRESLARAGLVVERVRPYLRPRLVFLWDLLELPQQLRVGGYRPFGAAWRRLPKRALHRLAERLAAWDLSAQPPGGGRLIVARKVDRTRVLDEGVRRSRRQPDSAARRPGATRFAVADAALVVWRLPISV